MSRSHRTVPPATPSHVTDSENLAHLVEEAARHLKAGRCARASSSARALATAAGRVGRRSVQVAASGVADAIDARQPLSQVVARLLEAAAQVDAARRRRSAA